MPCEMKRRRGGMRCHRFPIGSGSSMHKPIIAVAFIVLAACGAETATTAATSSTIKKREIEEGKKTTEQTRQRVDQLLEQGQQRNRASDAEK